MEIRIAKIEREIAIISTSMNAIAKTLEKMSDVNTQTLLQAQSIATMDREIGEAFKRVHARLDDEREARRWLSRSFIVVMIASVAKMIFDKITLGS